MNSYFKLRILRSIRIFLNIKLHIISISFLIGVSTFFNPYFAILILIISLILKFQYLILSIIFFALGFLYVNQTNLGLPNQFSQDIFEGYIVKTPKDKDYTKELTIKVEGIEHLLIAEVDKYYPINIYDEISFEGQIKEIPLIPNSTFNYREYLYTINVIGKIDKIKILKVSISNSPLKLLSIVKFELLNTIDSILQEPYSGLIKGILLGEVSTLDTNLKEDLKESGIYHIVSISGFNVSIIYSSLILILSRVLHRLRTILISTFIIIIFMVFIGSDNLPVLRATIMLCSTSAGLLFGRRVKGITSLILSTFIIILINPYYILNLSMLLSTLATLGILLFSSTDNFFSIDFIKENLSNFKTSLTAITFTSGITFLAFKEINLLGLFSNIFILPLIPLIMLIGLILIVLEIFNAELPLLILKICTTTLLDLIYSGIDLISSNLTFKFENIFILAILIFTLFLIDFNNFKKKPI